MDRTVWASGMTTSGSRNGRVGGLAVWLPGTQFWFVPGLVFAPELGGLLVVTPDPLLEIDCPEARALKPFFAISMPTGGEQTHLEEIAPTG